MSKLDSDFTADDRRPIFSESYCRRHGIYREGFLLVVLQRTLHPHVRPIFSLLQEIRPHYFAADVDFVVALGRMRNYSDFELARREFNEHPANRGFLRRWLRMRVSVRRMRRVLNEIYARRMVVFVEEPSESDSLSPFDLPQKRRAVDLSDHQLSRRAVPLPARS